MRLEAHFGAKVCLLHLIFSTQSLCSFFLLCHFQINLTLMALSSGSLGHQAETPIIFAAVNLFWTRKSRSIIYTALLSTFRPKFSGKFLLGEICFFWIDHSLKSSKIERWSGTESLSVASTWANGEQKQSFELLEIRSETLLIICYSNIFESLCESHIWLFDL